VCVVERQVKLCVCARVKQVYFAHTHTQAHLMGGHKRGGGELSGESWRQWAGHCVGRLHHPSAVSRLPN